MKKGKHQTKKMPQVDSLEYEELTAEELSRLEPSQTIYENFNDEQLASFSKELAKLIKKYSSQQSSPSEK